MSTLRWQTADDVIGRQTHGIEGIGLYRPKLSEEASIDRLGTSGLRRTSLSWLAGLLDEFGPGDAQWDDEVRDAIGAAQRSGAAYL
ncbi:MAG: hypothetical protein AAF907_14135, partial [Planctomycetota bacterium]